METDIYTYILDEESNYKTMRVPLTGSKDWNMHEHIERCTNVANAWFHKGANDGERPYDDIVTPIFNVAVRSEGFDVKDIVPYVNDAKNYYKSFLVSKYHPKWARNNELDTFIDDLVETSVIYDLALVKNVKGVRPEVVSLPTIAFCDQTDVLAGPLCIKHQFSISQLQEYSGRWRQDKVEEAIVMAKAEKTVSNANDAIAKTPGKYLTVYELHGMLPESWLEETGDPDKYVMQMHIVTYYNDATNKKNGITLFKAKEAKLPFKALKIDRIKSNGRACGKSIVESLFEPQVWNNYSAIKLKRMMDSAINIFQTDSDDIGNQKISNIKEGTILKHEQGKPITKVESSLANVTVFTNAQAKQEQNARLIGSASDAQLGVNPTSGTPFALQQLIVQQGQGIHEYRQGKIATFFADQLYKDWILGYLVDEMNGGKTFSEELTLDEMQEIAQSIAENEAEKQIAELMFSNKVVTKDMKKQLIEEAKAKFMKRGKRGFFKTLQNELKDIPVDVYVNIKGKQKQMAQNADKLSNLISNILKNPGAVAQIPGVGKLYNELLEQSGFSPVDFTAITKQENVPAQVGAGQDLEE